MLVFVDKITPRVRYIFDLLLNDLVGTPFHFAKSKEEFIQSKEEKLSYAVSKICDEVFVQRTADLLYEIGVIKQQNITLNSQDKDFDMFSAAFMCVSRYEEYLPFDSDIHKRYPASSSSAFKQGLLHLPLVNLWAKALKARLIAAYPHLVFRNRQYNFINTIDVDSVFAFKGKGLALSLAGLCRDVLVRRNAAMMLTRIKILLDIEEDIANNFDFITKVAEDNKAKTMFFMQVGRYGRFDKNINIKNRDFQTIIRRLATQYKIGIHPSYASDSKKTIIEKEIKNLQNVIPHQPIADSRFHFIRFSLPKSYNVLTELGITDDYSMGYTDKVGFRASICTPYHFYDLQRETQTPLVVHPYAIMDVTLQQYYSQTPLQTIKTMIDAVKAVDGEFISVFHNQNMSETDEWKGWKSIYKQTIEYANRLSQ
ncbi:MAG: polysaccharide deacetylase family protein [Bacteroidales bacterium]|jgi:hypothetical protein|nr:polysaccharide deacetylase family protein [Bacteroidales bacterium]